MKTGELVWRVAGDVGGAGPMPRRLLGGIGQPMGNGIDRVSQLLQSYDLFEKIYDIIRIVDPIRKSVVDWGPPRKEMTAVPCYAINGRDEFCQNCVSARALTIGTSFVKLDYVYDRVHVVTAFPVELNGETYVVELFKDAGEIFQAGGNPGEAWSMVDMIKNLNDRAVKDGLTGVYNRRYIDERLPVELVRAQAAGKPVSVIIGDLDHFKATNDTYGHAAGDIVLQVFAGLLVDCVREGRDWVARYGGEEFFVCLPGTDREGAQAVSERMRQKLAQTTIAYEGRAIRVTASFGVSSFPGAVVGLEKPATAGMLLREADQNLYAAKQGGRNKVVA